jgi:hypothetical protein
MTTGGEKSIEGSVSVKLMKESFSTSAVTRKSRHSGISLVHNWSEKLAKAVLGGFRYPIFPDLVDELGK